ncbi:MAG: LysM peptidoglycan-binding domain-containing protein [Anaerolineaceae bacterium]|nr:LysM peptidoglycan-binding domain-containing protein [Anaerolineaceae bacterium]
MLGRKPPQEILSGFEKKRRFFPVFIAILAVLLVIIGIVIIVLWVSKGGSSFKLFKKGPTPTSTMPPTPVLSPTPSLIPTETPTPTLTVSPTPSGPFEYEVQEFDSCWEISEKFGVDLQTLLAINNFEDGTCPIIPGQKIKVPAPGQTLPTPTLIPPDLPKGTRIDYTVQAGDSIASIASRLNSTVEDIIEINKDKIDDENNLPVGLILVIRVNLVTPTPTLAPTSTLAS